MKASTRTYIESLLSAQLKEKQIIRSCSAVSGGSINEAYRIDTNTHTFFVKLNDPKKFPGMFAAEVKGLELLKRKSPLRIPEVIACAEEQDSILVLEFLPSGTKDPEFFRLFGQQLAKQHQQSADKFGLDHDNYIGSLNQVNRQHSRWTDFFIEERLQKQLEMAVDAKRMDREMIKSFERFYRRLDELLPLESPALLHGDLWSGNYMCTGKAPSVFDPAVYYGHREIDIAMSRLFGGFAPEFYESYQEHYPMEKGWQQRVDICNLYPLMVHVNLFGGSYLHDVQAILKRF